MDQPGREVARRVLARFCRYGLFVFAVALVALGAASSPAGAHSFLVRTSPAAGSRLDRPPREVVLDFSESLAQPPALTVRTLDGRAIVSSDAQLDETALRSRLDVPPMADDVYLVSWHVTADDGHSTEGEFAFAVGVSPPAVAFSDQGGTTDWLSAIAAFVLLGGLSVAIGGLWSRRWLLLDAGSARTVQWAVAAALAGALGRAVLTADDLGVSSGDRWSELAESRPGRLDLALLAVLAATALVVRRRPNLVAVPLLVFAAAVLAIAGHAGDTGWWARPATTAHIAVGGMWVGALWHLGVVARRRERQRAALLREGAERYARFAAVTAGAAVGLGVLAAAAQLDGPDQLLDTRYGRLLLGKSALVAAALAVALVARRRGLPAEGERARRLAALTTAEASVLAAVVAVSAVLASTATPRDGARFVLGPPPIPEPATWSADLAGSAMVTAAAAADLLQVQVTGTDSQPANDTAIEITGREPDGTALDIEARSCGPGCATTFHRWQLGITVLDVTIEGSGDRGTATLRLAWPPSASADALLAIAVESTRAAPRLDVTETVRSADTAVSGPYLVTIDAARFLAGEPYAAGADDVRLLVDGEARSLTFVVPGSNIWGQLWLDSEHRIVREVLVDPGHRIDRSIVYP